LKPISPKLEKALTKAQVRTGRRHLFLCLGPDCCQPREGEATWDYIKKRTKELELEVMRTKALCFRICESGPWLVVYPEGIWYSKVTPQRFERILQDHLLGGKPVEKWVVARNALGLPA
jgi:(2Fe-2S) ferredoxin